MPATNKSLALHTTPSPIPADQKPQGWDPFEVWRTRVLLPRLAEERTDKIAASSALQIQLVRP